MGNTIDGGNIKFKTLFDSDISGLQKAKSALDEIKKGTIFSLKMDFENQDLNQLEKQLQKAQSSASQLSNMLDAAYNKDLGKLNISAFEKQLSQSKTSLQQIYNSMTAIGPAGEQAFQRVATEVLTTNTQLQKSKTFLDQMAETMSNTVKWGVASSIMKNFTTSVQQAYKYVQNLDYSLNQIRIVSNQSADSMDKFAVKANNSAKALGAATKTYTDASLIYFQQGLGMEEATARTDVTIKMSNALGESASKVSDYMTAIWNNFDDGSKSLEYFGDVLAKLGASTASSAEEIAEGLDKFAAVGNTVGLSYEYATTALATVVAETRQSADVVGTAFKTLFARIQDLELGKTLDDDTTLGTYSQALQAVGIQIKDQQGSLKDMDDILNEMGAKWKTLGKDQQVALAQQVAGVRQYTQLMALMNNWDTFNKNLKTAQTSTGTLEEQQAIYMESIDAHAQQLKTTWEELYSGLTDTDSINNILDGLTEAVELVDNFVDALGGGKQILLLLGATGLKVFDKQIVSGISNVISNFENAKAAAQELNAQTEIFNKFKMVDTESSVYEKILDMTEQRIKYQDQMNEAEIEEVNNLIKSRSEIELLRQELEETKNSAENFYQILGEGTKKSIGAQKKKILDIAESATQNYAEGEEPVDMIALKEKVNTRLNARAISSVSGDEAARDVLQNFWEVYGDAQNATKKLDIFQKTLGEEQFRQLSETVSKAREELQEFVNSSGSIQESSGDVEKYREAWNQVDNTLNILNENIETVRTSVSNGAEAAKKYAEDIKNETSKTVESLAQASDASFGAIMNKEKTKEGVQVLTDLASGAMSYAMAIQTIQNLGSIWRNEDLSTGEKLLQTLMAVSMTIQGLSRSIPALKKSFSQLKNIDFLNKDINIKELIKNREEKKKNARTPKISIDKEKADQVFEKKSTTEKDNLAFLEKESKATTDAGLRAADAVTGSSPWAANQYANAVHDKGTLNAIRQEKEEKQDLLKTEEALGKIKQRNNNFDSLSIDTKTSLITLQKSENITDEEKIALEKAIISGNYKNITAETLEKATKEGVITAQEAENLVKTEGIAVNKALGASMSGLMTGILIAGAAISFAISQWNSYKEASNQAIQDNNDAIIEEANARKEEISTVKDAAASYIELEKAQGGMNQDEYISKKNELIQSLGSEKKHLDELIASYKDYDAALNAFKTEKAKEQAEEDQKILEAQQSNVDLATHTGKIDIWGEVKNVISQYGADIGTEFGKGGFKGYAKGIGKIALPLISGPIGGLVGKYALKTDTNDQQIERDVDRVQQGLSAKGTYTLKDLQQMTAAQRNVLAGGAENYQQLLEAGQSADQSKIESMVLDTGALDVTTKESARQVYESIIDNFNKAAEEGDFAETDESAKELLDNYLASFDNSFISAIQDVESKREDTKADVRQAVMGQKTSEGINLGWALGAGAETEDGKKIAERFDSIYTEIAQNEGFQQLLSLTGKDGKLVINWAELLNIDDAEAQQKKLEDIFEENKELIQENYQLTSGKELDAKTSSAYLSSFDEDYSMSEAEADENLQSLIQMKDTYLSIYPDMKDQFEVLEKTQLAGTQEYKKALSDLADWQEEQHVKELQNIVKEKEAELAVLKKIGKASKEDIQELQTSIKAAKKDLNLAIDSGLSSFKDQIEDTSKQMKSLSESYQTITTIAKDYNDDGKLTLDNLESLLNMNWEYLSILKIQNGQMTINKDAAKAMLKIKLNEARQKIWEYTMNQLIAGSEKEINDQMDLSASYMNEYNENLGEVAKTMTSTTEAAWDLAKALAANRGVDIGDKMTSYQKQVLEVADVLFSAVGAIDVDNIDATLGKSGTSTQADKLEYIVDKYEKINRIIEKLSRNLEKLQDQQDKLVGADLLSNFNQQTEVLNEQNKAYEKKLELQKEEAASLRSQLAGYGATFDQDNNINYNAFMVGITNAANAGSISEDQYDRYKEAADNYKELWESSIQEVEDSITETANKLAEIELQKLNVKVNMQLDVSDATRQYNEWYNNVVKHATRAFGSITNVLTGELAKKNVETYMDDTIAWIEKFKSSESLYKKLAEGDTSIDQSAILDDLKTSTQGLMEAMNNIESEYKNVSDTYLASIDDWAEALDNINSDYESINSQLSHAVSLTKLLFGDNSYSTQNQYLSKSINTGMQQLQFAQQQAAKFQKKMNEALAKGDDELYEKYKEKYSSWLSNMNNTLDTTLQNIQTKYTNSLSQIFADFEKNILSTSLDKANEEWDRLKTSAGLYLDKVNKAYEITKLQTKYIKQINSTSNVDIQNKINKAMEAQIKALKNKTKLSKYDVDLANARYETLVAEIALQEAQANKTKMQLQRDSQGNYSYVYSQDEDAVADAKDKAESARVNEWNIIKEKNDSIVSDFSTQMKNFETALQKAYTDNMSDPKAREEEIKKIISEFKPIFGGLGDQWSTARDDMAEWISSDQGISVKSVTDDMIKGYYPNWNNNMVDMLTKMGNSNDFEKLANDIAKEADIKTTEYQTQTSQVLAAAKTSLSEIKDGLYGASEDTQLGKILKKDSEIATAAQNNMNKLEALKEKVSEIYNNFMEKYGTIAKGYLKNSESWLKNINTTTQKYEKSLDSNVATIKSKMSDITTAINNSKVTEEDIRKAVSSAIGEYVSSDSGSSSSSSFTPPLSDKGKVEAAGGTDTEQNKKDLYTQAGSVRYNTERTNFEKTLDSSFAKSDVGTSFHQSNVPIRWNNYSKQTTTDGTFEYNNTNALTGEKTFLVYKNNKKQGYYIWRNGVLVPNDSIGQTFFSSYDTGGYTGDWSNSTGQYKDGKLALLHKKELILNEDDTENILAAVEGIRSMSGIIEMLDAFTRSRYSATFNSIKQPSFNDNQSSTDNSSVVTQNIEINADFSGLHDAQELENAIDNLSNRALQYAYKNI